MIGQITFHHDALSVLLLFSFLLIGLYAYLNFVRKKVTKKYVSTTKKGSYCRSQPLFWLKCVSFSLAWAFASIALMQPETQAQPKLLQDAPVRQAMKIDEVALLFDVSASMSAKDEQQGATRLDRAKEIAGAMIDTLGGVFVSVYAFGGDVQEMVPPTFDYLSARQSIQRLRINATKVTGTNFSSLSEKMLQLSFASGVQKNVLFVLFSDGEDPNLMQLDANSKRQAYSTLASQFEVFQTKNTKWFVVCLGSETGAFIPIQFQGKEVRTYAQPEFMQDIAEITHGNFYDTNDNILQMVEDLDVEAMIKPAIEMQEKPKSLALFPILGACFFFILALLLPEVYRHA